jgi:hypothetical protein
MWRGKDKNQEKEKEKPTSNQKNPKKQLHETLESWYGKDWAKEDKKIAKLVNHTRKSSYGGGGGNPEDAQDKEKRKDLLEEKLIHWYGKSGQGDKKKNRKSFTEFKPPVEKKVKKTKPAEKDKKKKKDGRKPEENAADEDEKSRQQAEQLLTRIQQTDLATLDTDHLQSLLSEVTKALYMESSRVKRLERRIEVVRDEKDKWKSKLERLEKDVQSAKEDVREKRTLEHEHATPDSSDKEEKKPDTHTFPEILHSTPPESSPLNSPSTDQPSTQKENSKLSPIKEEQDQLSRENSITQVAT